jgi:hypothetical protein
VTWSGNTGDQVTSGDQVRQHGHRSDHPAR